MTKPVPILNSTDVYKAVLGRNTLLPADARVVSKAYPVLAAVGALVTVGGVFTLLAAYQILPAGANLMSGLGTKALVVGYVATSAGPIFLVVYLLKKRSVKKSNYKQASSDLSTMISLKLQDCEFIRVKDAKTNRVINYYARTGLKAQTETIYHSIDLNTLKERKFRRKV